MTDTAHERWSQALALHVLGGLPTDEHEALSEHLRQCPSCRAEQAMLETMVRVMGDAPNEPVPEPSTELGQRVLDSVARARRDQHRQSVLARISGVAAAIVLTASLTTVVTQPAAGPPTESVALGTVAAGVDATADLVAHTWGTELKLVADGLRPGEVYSVRFVARDGTEVGAGTFIGVSDRPIVCDMNAALLRADATAFVITDTGGETVLHADLPAVGA